MEHTVSLLGNTFNKNTGTKGLIYLDMKHSAAKERAAIVGNIFTYNAGYLDSSAIYIRARGPTGKDVYNVLGSDSEAYCGGYII